MAALRKCLALAVVLATMGAAPVSADVPDPVVDDTAAPVTVTFDPEQAEPEWFEFGDGARFSSPARSSWGRSSPSRSSWG
jgi:opacity protein-like surface antigen